MERINLRKYEGFESIDSSQLYSIKGGISFRELWAILKTLEEIYNTLKEYKDDFMQGFEEGWNMV